MQLVRNKLICNAVFSVFEAMLNVLMGGMSCLTETVLMTNAHSPFCIGLSQRQYCCPRRNVDILGQFHEAT